MYTKKSIPKLKSGAASGKDPNIILININDINAFPTTDANGVKTTGDLTLKADAKAIALYATPSSISFGAPGAGDPDAKGFTASVEFDHPGNSLAKEEFEQNNINENFVLIVKGCGTADETRLFGMPCAPMAFATEETNSSEATRTHFTFTQTIASEYRPLRYEGDIPTVYEDWTAEVEEEEGA